MKILITGATGLIGQEIIKSCLAKGMQIHYLSTRKNKLDNNDHVKGFYWNPTNGEIDLKAFEGVSAIINLAGASISKRWTKQYKELILNSRIDAVELLYQSLSEIEHQVSQFISASGVALYPNSTTDQFSETCGNFDDNFLAEVVMAWEASTDVLQNLGIEVVKVRTGMVLSKAGGAFPQLIKPIKLGLGAPIGSGNQWQSWIHIRDIVGIYIYILENKLTGVYNGVAPQPETNKDLTRKIAAFLNKPLWLPNIPKFILRFILGEMSILAIEGQFVSSQKIESAGFRFRYRTFEEALSELLKKNCR